MIPTIKSIIEGLIAGTISQAEAEGWLATHIELAEQQAAAFEHRDILAAAALQGLLANAYLQKEFLKKGMSDMHPFNARVAYEAADAMLKAREGA